jgi:hypothetical protein
MKKMQKEQVCKKKIDPAETLFFAGFIIQTTSKEFERIKQFILTQTMARLIYQHRDERYLRINIGETNEN